MLETGGIYRKGSWAVYFPVGSLFGQHTWATWTIERELENMVGEEVAVELSAPLFDMSQMDDFPKGRQTGEKLLNSSCLSRLHQEGWPPGKGPRFLGWTTLGEVKEVENVKPDFSHQEVYTRKGRTLETLRRTYIWEDQWLHACPQKAVWLPWTKQMRTTNQSENSTSPQAVKQEAFTLVPLLLPCLNKIEKLLARG